MYFEKYVIFYNFRPFLALALSYNFRPFPVLALQSLEGLMYMTSAILRVKIHVFLNS